MAADGAWRQAVERSGDARDVMDVYPTNLREWIDQRGGLTPRMIFLRGRELAAIVPTCGLTTTASASAGTATAAVHDTPALRADPARGGPRTTNAMT